MQSTLILAGIVGLFTLVGYSLFGWTGVLFILGISLVFNFLTLNGSARLILRLHRARPVSTWEAPALHQIANTLAHRAGMSTPRLAVYPSDVPNAFTLGSRQEEGIVAVSSGLLRLLDGREMAGVLAHEYAHLKNRDSLLSLSAGLFVQAISALSSLFGFALLFLILTGSWGGSSFLLAILLVTAAPHAATALQAALMRTREFLADRDASQLTGDPTGLANALYKLERHNRYLSGLYRRFRFIYTSDTGSGPRWLRTHPPTEERIQNLLELEEKTITHPAFSPVKPRRIAVL
jgi:heat shock protein HtpX